MRTASHLRIEFIKSITRDEENVMQTNLFLKYSLLTYLKLLF